MNAVGVDRDTREAVEAFMFREAELLDGGQFREWLGLLDPDIRYVDFSWAESPRSRTRHFVSNIRTTAGPGTDELTVRSNLLFFRSRGDSGRWELLSAERVDVLRRTDDSLRLARREVLLDHSTLPIDNLSVFL